MEPITDLKIDLNGGKTYATNYAESFNTTDSNGDGLSNVYNSLIQNTYGNYNISTSLIKTALVKVMKIVLSHLINLKQTDWW